MKSARVMSVSDLQDSGRQISLPALLEAPEGVKFEIEKRAA